MDVTHQGQWNDPADRPWCPRCRTVPVPSKMEHLLLGDNAEGNASSSHAVDLDHSSLSSHSCGTGARRCQGSWTRSWSRELRNFLKSTLALRMFLPVSAWFNRSHECLSSLVSSTAVSRPGISIVAEHLSSMCSHLSSIRAAIFSASCSSYLPYSRLQQDWACLKVARSLTSKLMAGRSSTVCPFRFWKLTRELRSLGSSSISN
ncbi:uncharacterized protein [Vicugna pacos]|uniref:Uncharacterized protein n=1 Tax=Vicugna pacos TaxID=30538 RepID=A0ABM5CWV8_VICPA